MAPLVVPQPSACSLWAQAIDDLPDEHKHNIDFNNSERIDILKDLREKAESSRKRFLESRWKFTRKSGETVIMRDLFDKLVRWIDTFKAIGDLAVQYDPTHVSLPWAGIRFILQITVNDTNKLELVMESLTLISELICRYTIVENWYSFHTSPAHEKLGQAIVKLYAKILSHLSYTKIYFDQGTLKRLSKSAGPDHTFHSSLSDIHKAEDEVTEWRPLAERKDNSENYEKLKRLLDDMEQPLRKIDHSLENIEDNLEVSRRIRILQWLSSEPYLGHHKQVKEDLLKGTGNWLLDNPIFKKWKNDSASSILWLHGIAGSGKSKLISMVIDDAIKNFQAGNIPQPVFFYCSRNPAEPTRSNPRAILASIMRQLSNTAPEKPLLEPTVNMYEKEESQGFASGQPGMRESCELIMQLIGEYPQTTIVIDAMDECDPQKRWELLEFLENILQNAPSLVKVFVSSRNDQDIVYKLKNYPNLEIDSRANGRDIVDFVENEVNKLVKQGKLLRHSQSPDKLKQLIISKTVEGAHEMFRWASMQLQHLCLLNTDDDVRHALGRLPPDLRTLYNDLYDRLTANPGELGAILLNNSLHWLLSAQMKLETNEFLAAVTMMPHKSNRFSVTREQILGICNNFLVHDSELRTFRFAHLSVREFLEGRPEFSVPSSNSLIAEACLWALLCGRPSAATRKLFRNLDWKLDGENLIATDIKDYADLFWAAHCKLAGDGRRTGTLQAILNHIFLDEKRDRASSIINLWLDRVGKVLDWRNTESLCSRWQTDAFFMRDNGNSASLSACRPSSTLPCSTKLLIICAYDLDELGQERLVSEGLTIPYFNHDGESIATVAGRNGSYRMMLRMVTHKRFGVTFAKDMVVAAGIKDGEKVANLLTDHWQTDAKNRKVVLMTAIEHCSERVVERFLDSWEDTVVTQEMIEMAIRNRHYATELVTLLLQQRGEEFEITSEVLLNAIKQEHSSVTLIQRLLSLSTTEVKITQQMVETAVSNESSSTELVEFLLDQGGTNVKVTLEMIGMATSSDMLAFLFEYGAASVTVAPETIETDDQKLTLSAGTII